MQLALPSDSKAAYVSRLMIAGVAVAGASLFAMNAPTPTGPLVQQRDVKLAAGEVDWTTFLANVNDNLATLQSEGATASSELSTALGNVSTQLRRADFSTALTGFDTGVNNALFGGWYGGDDGYVFGLFGGEPVLGGPTPGITGSLIDKLSNDLSTISTNPNGSEQLFSDFNNYTLELLDHTLKPLLAPLLDETSQGRDDVVDPRRAVSDPDQPARGLRQLQRAEGSSRDRAVPRAQRRLCANRTTWTTSAPRPLRATAPRPVRPEQPAVGRAQRHCQRLRRRVNPVDGSENLFPGLINAGSFLDELYTTWTEQFVTALGSLGADSASSVAAESVSTALPDLFTGLF